MTAAPPIPIENIYYLFCYAWNRFEEAQSIPLGGTQSPDLPNLLGRVLLHGTRALLRRGLDRAFQNCSDEIATVRGHIDIGASLRLKSQKVRRLACEFDELSHDLLHNQIIKASLRRIARAQTIDTKLSHELVMTAQRMPDVSDIWLERSAFARVQLHRNNAYYDIILKVAELAYDCLLPDPSGAGYAFHDILRDEGKMARVFEDFVRNFYRAEQCEFAVNPLAIRWDALELTTTGVGRLPSMIVDIYLRSPNRRLIIDTKYYARALQQSLYGSESFQSGNLYQLFAYLKNAASDPAFAKCEGMLLYPQVGRGMRECFKLQGQSVTIATINLAQPWQQISSDLLSLLMPLPQTAEATASPG
ncbi:5-methylcytosine restriction system specificity protein McrC [Erythrobacter sp. W302b]|uniref:5-methylcytosine restriction system specificity protein McrC n=1 Tax=Erythrobacter sp. W302b TaxID=3389874 RepID=UPI00396AF509